MHSESLSEKTQKPSHVKLTTSPGGGPSYSALPFPLFPRQPRAGSPDCAPGSVPAVIPLHRRAARPEEQKQSKPQGLFGRAKHLPASPLGGGPGTGLGRHKPPRKRTGDILLEEGFITDEQLQLALQEQKKTELVIFLTPYVLNDETIDMIRREHEGRVWGWNGISNYAESRRLAEAPARN